MQHTVKILINTSNIVSVERFKVIFMILSVLLLLQNFEGYLKFEDIDVEHTELCETEDCKDLEEESEKGKEEKEKEKEMFFDLEMPRGIAIEHLNNRKYDGYLLLSYSSFLGGVDLPPEA